MDDIDKQIQTLQEELDKLKELKELKNKPTYGKVVLSDTLDEYESRVFKIGDHWAGTILHDLDRLSDGVASFPNEIPSALYLADCNGVWRTEDGTTIRGYIQYTPK